MLDLQPAAGEISRLLAGVTDEHLDRPTPSFPTVTALLDHLLGLTVAFTWAATKDERMHGTRGGVGGSALPDAWRDTLTRRLTALADAWHEPAACEGESAAGGVTMPAAVTGLVALDEIVLHGWDLARSTGQHYRCDDTTAQAVLGFTQQAASGPAAQRAGLFGDPVPVPSDASPFDRALGFAGRDPGWSA
jgi:uncharacterized protein (TIGR03086 family)